MNTSSTTNDSSVDPRLLSVPFQLNIWFGLLLFVAGNISCFGNMVVFSSRSFRRRAYSIYLIAEAGNNFVYFDFVLVTRMIQRGYRLPIMNRYDVLCRIRQFLSQYANQTAFLFFLFAALDRLLSTQRSLSKKNHEKHSSHFRR